MTATHEHPADILVEATHLSKRFKMYPRPSGRLLEWLSLGKVSRHGDFWALREINLRVRRGECYGIIGANGSGKSTLLKILTGVLTPTEGSIAIRGRILSLLELGVGVNPQLTGRQNVLSSAQLLAFPPGFAEEKMERIQEFSELGDFFDRPMRMYSSGMGVRLAFSMFACFDPEVFVVDEALSVGDVHFQQKCVKRIEEMRAGGTTFLFVSHDTSAVRRLCGEVMVLDHGACVFAGAPEEGVSRYYALCGANPNSEPRVKAERAAGLGASETVLLAPEREILLQNSVLNTSRGRHGERGLELLAATIQDSHGAYTLSVPVGESVVISLLIRAHIAVERPAAGLHLYDRLGNLIFAAGTRQLNHTLPPIAVGAEQIVRFRLTLSLVPGEYTLSLGTSEPSIQSAQLGMIHDRWEGIGPLSIFEDSAHCGFFGIARLPLEVL